MTKMEAVFYLHQFYNTFNPVQFWKTIGKVFKNKREIIPTQILVNKKLLFSLKELYQAFILKQLYWASLQIKYI